MTTQEDHGSLIETSAARIRDMLISGRLLPGQKLSEQKISTALGISRNTLREVFRLLTSQRLLNYIQNRGVFVAAPSEADLIDIYRLRRTVQRGGILASRKTHPALATMRSLAKRAEELARSGAWHEVGTTNMEFHRAMVQLNDSQRVSEAFELALAEMRLVFSLLEDSRHLHEPYISWNMRILEALEANELLTAEKELELYLVQSQSDVLAALARSKARPAGPGR